MVSLTLYDNETGLEAQTLILKYCSIRQHTHKIAKPPRLTPVHGGGNLEWSHADAAVLALELPSDGVLPLMLQSAC